MSAPQNHPLAEALLRGAPFAAIALGIFGASCKETPRPLPPSAVGPGVDAGPGLSRLTIRERRETAIHRDGRRGDFELVHTGSGASVTVGVLPNEVGLKPVRGALLDVAAGTADAPDPSLSWRVGVFDTTFRALEAEVVESHTCPAGAGIRVMGKAGETTLESTICPTPEGRFLWSTASTNLPAGAKVTDELIVGTSEVVASDRRAWTGEVEPSWLAVGDAGMALGIELPHAKIRRAKIRIAAEEFPAPIYLEYPAGAPALRTFRVQSGDTLDAVARQTVGPSVKFTASFANGAGGTVRFVDKSTGALALARIAPGVTRSFVVPPGMVDLVSAVDDDAILSPTVVDLSTPTTGAAIPTVTFDRGPRGMVNAVYTDTKKAPLPVHVLVWPKGDAVAPDFTRAFEPKGSSRARIFGAKNSVYALDGRAQLYLAPGTYDIVATHGPRHSLSRKAVTVRDGESVALADTVAEVVAADGWVSADFNLHAAPSPDAPGSLEARIASLACEGVDVAVATDHNHITDYGPTVKALGLSRPLPIVGDEITTQGTDLYGHFNAFPLPRPESDDPSRESRLPRYYGISPREIFASARALGAQIIQVNHARMPPRIGYFDLAGVDAQTGSAGPRFSDDFDAIEAFNGIWIESPDRVREGVLDLVAMARRGKMVAATGNSDSHQLLYQEAGYPRTYVRARGPSVEDAVVLGLRTRETTVSSGPFVTMSVNGGPIGSMQRVGTERTVRVRVRVEAPAWVPVDSVELWVDDTPKVKESVRGPARDGVRFEKEYSLVIAADATILAWAESQTPIGWISPYTQARAIGFTGLVYVDANGDGSVRVPSGSAGK